MQAAQTPPRDDGVIKYSADWDKQALAASADLSDLIHWRQAMFCRGLIGEYPDGVGYGNISQRLNDSSQFHVSGSATGGLESLDAHHFSLVTRVEVQVNRLWCRGLVMASSESMSHAVIYDHCPQINGIIHVHHPLLWRQLMDEVPSTPASLPYGTPEMAQAIIDLINHHRLAETGVFVMAGHEDGVFAFGTDLPEAADRLLMHYDRLQA